MNGFLLVMSQFIRRNPSNSCFVPPSVPFVSTLIPKFKDSQALEIWKFSNYSLYRSSVWKNKFCNWARAKKYCWLIGGRRNSGRIHPNSFVPLLFASHFIPFPIWKWKGHHTKSQTMLFSFSAHHGLIWKGKFCSTKYQYEKLRVRNSITDEKYISIKDGVMLGPNWSAHSASKLSPCQASPLDLGLK